MQKEKKRVPVKSPTLSVLIPTLGREKVLIDTVRSLLVQTRRPDEIVVVDQNTPSFPSVDEFFSGIPNLKHIRCPSPGVAPNYNRALKEATGDIVLFLDDDVVLDPKLIEAHFGHYLNPIEKLGGIAGRVHQPSGDVPPDQIRYVGRYFGFRGKMEANFNYHRPSEVQLAPGGNMSFYRKVLEDLGGFDEGFDGNGYFFESDMSLRVVKAGYKILFEPEAELDHLQAPSGGARIHDKSIHTYYYVKNGKRLYQKHGSSLGKPFYYSRLLGYALAKAAWNRDPKIAYRGIRALIGAPR